jgi:hypothetical protein
LSSCRSNMLLVFGREYRMRCRNGLGKHFTRN